MRHTLKAVFDRRSDAQHVLDELLASGYSRTDTEISTAEGLRASVRHRLARLFARQHAQPAEGASAVMAGRHVVTLTADSEPDAERAVRIIQRFHPVGIEDLPSEWDRDSAGVMPSVCPPGTAPGSLQYQAYGSSQYYGTQHAWAPPMGNTFGEPMIEKSPRSYMDTPWTGAAGSHSGDTAAYRYGQQMRASDRYRNRSWDEAEPELKSNWEASADEAPAWDTAMAAIRQGWDSVSPEIDDDAYYRTHWNARYGDRADSGAYDEHAPAYLFGEEARRLEKYRSHDWEDAEPHLKSDWEARHPGKLSPWENFKDAVKHGWNRINADMNDRLP